MLSQYVSCIETWLLGDCKSNSPNNTKSAIETLLEKDYCGTAEDALSVSAICYHALQDENILALVVLHNKKTFYTYDWTKKKA